MNIFRFEFRQALRQTWIWIAAMVFTFAVFLAMYSAVSNDVEGFKSILQAYPESIQQMLGINLDAIGSVLGYYAMTFSFLALVGCIQSATYGFMILSWEQREKTGDFLFSKPVSRSRIFWAKTAAMLVNVVLSALLVSLINYGIFCGGGLQGVDFTAYAEMQLILLILMVLFFALGLLLSLVLGKIKRPSTYGLSLAFALYIYSAFFGADSTIKRVFAPFKYFDLFKVIDQHTLELSWLMLSAAFILCLLGGSYVIYTRQETHLS